MLRKTIRLGRAHTPGAPQYRTTTFTFDGANQLVSSTTDGKTTRYAYDAAGRLVREGDRTYHYGYLDKVLSVTEGERTYTYDYHVDGQLARAVYGNGTGDDGRARTPTAPPAGSEDFLWDGLALIKRGDERFVNEPHVGGGNPVVSSKGMTYFNDILGTTVGAKRNRKYSAAALTAFGESDPASQPLNTSTSQQFFTGKPHVAGLGHAFLFRNYRAGLSKWQTSDPMGYPDGWNGLTYCENKVVCAVDILGCITADEARGSTQRLIDMLNSLTFNSTSGSCTFRSYYRGRQELSHDEILDYYTPWEKLNENWDFRTKYFNDITTKANVFEYVLVLPKSEFELFCEDMETLTWILAKLNIPYVSKVSEEINDGITVYKFMCQEEKEVHLGYMYSDIETIKKEMSRDEFRPRIE